MRLNGFDLNQLVCLEALLTERNVSRAAAKVHLSQSAMSAILAQLRDHFGDPLLTRAGRQMTPTPFAQSLAGPVNDLMTSARAFAARAPGQDLASVDRELRVVASDYLLETALADAIGRVRAEMPRLRFDILPLTAASEDLLRAGDIDLLLAGQAFRLRQPPNAALFEDRFACLTCAEAGRVEGALDRVLFFARRHIVVRYFEHRMAFEDDEALRRQGLDRQPHLSVWSYAMVPRLLAGTDMIATVTARIADRIAERWPVDVHDFPFEQDAVRVYGYWHPSREGDPVLARVVDALTAD